MSRGLNKVQIIGNCGQVETQEAKSGKITRISIATNEKWKDKATGEDKELVEWHRCVLFGKLAEIAQSYVKKGSKIYIEGKLRTTKYQDKETGADRYSTDIIASELQLLDKKEGGSAKPPAEAYDDIPKPYERDDGFQDDMIPF
jgi:single-strand DNA-binding protein